VGTDCRLASVSVPASRDEWDRLPVLRMAYGRTQELGWGPSSSDAPALAPATFFSGFEFSALFFYESAESQTGNAKRGSGRTEERGS